MTKLIPIFINGKKWVQLSQLSQDQVNVIKSWLPVNSLRKILFHGMEITDCLDFDTYEYWFNSNEVSKQNQSYLDF
jgi:hypothetical protein